MTDVGSVWCFVQFPAYHKLSASAGNDRCMHPLLRLRSGNSGVTRKKYVWYSFDYSDTRTYFYSQQ